MKKNKLLLFILIFISFGVFAQQFPAKPTTIVNDYAGILSNAQRQQLEDKLVAYDDTSSTQIAVAILRSLADYDAAGYEISDYGVRLATEWEVGRAGKDNGILILVSIIDKKMTIQTGYGLEGAVPDAFAKRIIENDMKPAFRDGNYFEGLDKATDRIIQYTSGEFANEARETEKVRPPAFIFLIFILIIILLFVFRIGAIRKYATINNIPFWIAWTLLNEVHRQHRGKYKDFTSGRGTFGGGGWGGSSGGSRGFGGFGGGRFGGGGASGSW